ncbi:MAG: sugar ABC transporter permease [Defluviitaleaceae bacterium]|nr:sugar ABC transporter permease [Defluviitaleaceae bacterium]
MKQSTKAELLFILLALPSLIGLMVFFLVPFAASLYLAMIDNPVGRNFVGLRHFIETINNGAFRLALRNTLIFIALCVPVNMIFPLWIAGMLNRAGKHKDLFGLFFLLPLVVPSGSVVHFWQSLFGINGAINGMFFAEAPINWLNTDWARPIILVIFMWKNAGFNIVLYQAGLNMIPKEYYEYAAVEGAGKWRQFRMVTLVYLTPTFFMVFLMSLVQSFRSFREIYLLAGSHPHRSIYMLQHYMNNLFDVLNYQRLAAASYILSVGIIGIVLVLFFAQRKVDLL